MEAGLLDYYLFIEYQPARSTYDLEMFVIFYSLAIVPSQNVYMILYNYLLLKNLLLLHFYAVKMKKLCEYK